jgi:hypothetical protein
LGFYEYSRVLSSVDRISLPRIARSAGSTDWDVRCLMVVESLDKVGSDVLFVVQIGEGELCNDGRAAECIR